MVRLPRVIAAARILADLSQKQLAEEAGIAESVLAAIERGTSDPKNKTLLAIADALLKHGVRIVAEDERVIGGAVIVRGVSDIPASPHPD